MNVIDAITTATSSPSASTTVLSIGNLGVTPEAQHLAKLRQASLPDEEVAASVTALARPLIESLPHAYDVVLVVLRGGGLLTPALEQAGHAVSGVLPYALVLPTLVNPAPRVLVCDTMAETGKTLVDITQLIAATYPDAEVELLTVFSTDAALERLRPSVAAFHNAHRIAPDAFYQVAMDLPYDFGDVAENVGLSGARLARPPRPIAGVIFDFDDTLIDSGSLYFEVDSMVLAERGVTLTHELNAEFMGHSPRAFWEHLIREFELSETADALLAETRARYLPVARAKLELLPHMLDCIRWFGERGYPMAVASGSSRDVLESLLSHFGIRDSFEVVLSSEQVAHHKPAPDVFLEAAARMGLDPAELLVFEDSAAGVLAARRARMRCVAIPSSADAVRPSHHMADLLFESGRAGFDLDLVIDRLLPDEELQACG
ncbi:MAG: HAD family phosphatase [Deltaproteobacteria bacterium]|nr:HAD family phosphatase [Deltaproteobacteria bacterium]